MNNGRHNNGIYRNLNRRQQTVRKRRKNRLTIVLILVVALCLIWVIALFGLSRLWNKENPSETTVPVTDETGDTDKNPADTTAPAVTEPAGIKYTTVKMNQGDVKKGELILINSDFPYVFPANPEAGLKTLYGNKNLNYKISRSDTMLRTDLITKLNSFFDEFFEHSGKDDVQVVAGFRTFAKQEELYNKEVAENGPVEAAKYVALPGNSEHHTGTAIDLNIYDDAGKTYDLVDKPEYAWITDNIHKYGFILRYPEDKIGLTGIAYESWHFRYVGVPHSYIIRDKGLCLEEYTADIRNHPFTGEHLEVEANGTKYEIYYVACAEGENVPTDVPVPEGLEYTISGNNVDGFVVTVTLK